MLQCFELKKIGYSESIKINDVFEHEQEVWVVRAIASSSIANRYVNSGGMSGFQNDVIKASIVAQKVGTFNLSNSKAKTTEIIRTTQTSAYIKSKQGGALSKVGDIADLGDGSYYIATEIKEIKFNFIDMVTVFEASSVTEMPKYASKSIHISKKLNELGWEVIK